jgi:hypothetical protein
MLTRLDAERSRPWIMVDGLFHVFTRCHSLSVASVHVLGVGILAWDANIGDSSNRSLRTLLRDPS